MPSLRKAAVFGFAVVTLAVAMNSARADPAENPRALYEKWLNLREVSLSARAWSQMVEQENTSRQLVELAHSGNREAAYYAGLVWRSDGCNKERHSSDRLLERICENAAFLFRKAAEKGHYAAAAALGDAYRGGHGVTKSALAAIDWYYKAARIALENKDREFALTMLEEVVRLGPTNPLRTDLEERLYLKGLDENTPKRRRQPEKLTY